MITLLSLSNCQHPSLSRAELTDVWNFPSESNNKYNASKGQMSLLCIKLRSIWIDQTIISLREGFNSILFMRRGNFRIFFLYFIILIFPHFLGRWGGVQAEVYKFPEFFSYWILPLTFSVLFLSFRQEAGGGMLQCRMVQIEDISLASC